MATYAEDWDDLVCGMSEEEMLEDERRVREKACFDGLMEGQQKVRDDEREEAVDRFNRKKRGKCCIAAGITIFGGMAFFTHPILGLFYSAIVLIVLGFIEIDR